MKTVNILAKNLRILRATDNGRQDAIAFAAGLSRTHMGTLENGKANPTLETLEKIANAYSVTVAYLLTDHSK